MASSFRNRTRFVFFGIFLASAVLISSLYSTQIIHGENYAAKGNTQYSRPSGSLFERGSIYFHSKEKNTVLGATIERGNVLYINPKQLASPEQAYEAISEFIDIDKNLFMKGASNKNISYVELAHHLSDEEVRPISDLLMPGLGTVPETWRSYPSGGLAAQTLGLVGEDSSTSTVRGKYGLERYYENILGRDRAKSTAHVFAELFSNSKAVSAESHEGDITTTIEPTVQSYLEKVLSETDVLWHPDEIGGIIMDPQTGEIYALASLPSFDGNDTAAVKSTRLFSNPLVEHVYEMGSILKPLTMATGLDTDVITAHSTYDDTGTMTLSGKKISNYDGRARGITDMQSILSQSLNIGAATIGLKVGNEKMAKYFAAFGLGTKTGIDLPNEATGLIKNLKIGRDIDIATASYGQGIAVSPVAMTRALSILGNGGYLVQPHIVKKITYVDGDTKDLSYGKEGPIIKKESAHEVTNMLVKVVDEALKQGRIKNEHYSVAAKTGTAQIPDHESGGYYTDRYLHSFFGYFPAYDPKFIVFLYQIYPKGAEYASDTLTDPFDNLSKFLLNYYNIPPDR